MTNRQATATELETVFAQAFDLWTAARTQTDPCPKRKPGCHGHTCTFCAERDEHDRQVQAEWEATLAAKTAA